jgi:hypothetical protein
MRAFIICFVKAICIGIALGLKESFCKNKITSDILQPSTSKSLKEVELLSSILQKNLALFVEKVFAVLGFLAQGAGVFSTPEDC